MEIYLVHHGIKGQKWGVRKYQNQDGSLTPAGRQRYYGSGGIYGINDRYYTKEASNYQKREAAARTMARMNRNAASNGPKLLKGVYELNDRYYTKKADKLRKKGDVARTIASMNRAAAEERAKKRLEKEVSRADNISNKYNKKTTRSQKSDDRTLELRQKNRERLENKYKKKIQKGKITKQDAKKKLSEFDNATTAVKSGLNRYNNIISTYGQMKAKAAIDPSVKESKAYKDAAKAYMSQKFSDLFSTGGSDYTKLKYTVEELRKNKNN